MREKIIRGGFDELQSVSDLCQRTARKTSDSEGVVCFSRVWNKSSLGRPSKLANLKHLDILPTLAARMSYFFYFFFKDHIVNPMAINHQRLGFMDFTTSVQRIRKFGGKQIHIFHHFPICPWDFHGKISWNPHPPDSHLQQWHGRCKGDPVDEKVPLILASGAVQDMFLWESHAGGQS